MFKRMLDWQPRQASRAPECSEKFPQPHGEPLALSSKCAGQQAWVGTTRRTLPRDTEEDAAAANSSNLIDRRVETLPGSKLFEYSPKLNIVRTYRDF